jgi:hypothetical protein
MKRLLILATVLIFAVSAFSQRSGTILQQEMGAITLNGAVAGTASTLPPVLGEFDVSIQLIPALSLAGDSLWFSYIPYQSNSMADDVWTALAAADTVGTTTDSDAIYEITDFKGLRLKVICTGISADTCTVTPYIVYKKHAQE